MPNLDTFWDRLVYAMQMEGKDTSSQAAIGKFGGVGQTGARKWQEGLALPTLKRVVELAVKLNVRTEWLLSGREPMRPISDKEMDLIRHFRTLPEYKREKLTHWLEIEIALAAPSDDSDDGPAVTGLDCATSLCVK